jgi:hypothetical protein
MTLDLKDANSDISALSLADLRIQWVNYWGMQPPKHIGRKMLEISIKFKIRELRGEGFTPLQQARLDQLIRSYKRNPKCFDTNDIGIKPGTRLVRMWKGEKHSVMILPAGFEYQGKVFGSLSRVAREITGTYWNGWKFFHLTKKKIKA